MAKKGAGYREIQEVLVWGEPIDNAVTQMVNCREGAVHRALMADHHLGYAVPIGGVIAYQDQVSPSGVGFDIACGNKAVRLDIPGEEVQKNISSIMDDIHANLSFGMGRTNPERPEHPLFEAGGDPAWSIPEVSALKRLAANQLGTIGSGNHYVDVFLDEEGRVWVGVHFGSRGLGHKIATHFIKAGGGTEGMHADPVLLDVHSDLGEQYLLAMRLAGRYAQAGRDWALV